MAEGIPVNASDLPIGTPLLDDSVTHEVALEKVAIALKNDKNGRPFISVQCSIINNDTYEGLQVNLNYLRTPLYVPAEAANKMKVRAHVNNGPFGEFARSFKLKGQAPEITDFRNEAERAAFMEWIEGQYGATGVISVVNEEYPEGSGRFSSRIKGFVF